MSKLSTIQCTMPCWICFVYQFGQLQQITLSLNVFSLHITGWWNNYMQALLALFFLPPGNALASYQEMIKSTFQTFENNPKYALSRLRIISQSVVKHSCSPALNKCSVLLLVPPTLPSRVTKRALEKSLEDKLGKWNTIRKENRNSWNLDVKSVK